MNTIILIGNALTLTKNFENDYFQTIVTSPPYYGLRDYGHDAQIGLEQTPQEYVDTLVALFRECRRVLHPTGTFWLNIGDTYARDVKKGQHKAGDPGKQNYVYEQGGGRASAGIDFNQSGFKPKDLIGVPWMLAFALRQDGWYLRSDIIWHKPNAMPESVKDRPTNCYEHIFLFTKNESYLYDSEAVKEKSICPRMRGRSLHPDLVSTNGNSGLSRRKPKEYRNRRNFWSIDASTDAWTVNTQGFKGAHFATFPPDLIEPCIKAGTSEHGNCITCGNPWKRLTGKPCDNCGELIPTQAKSCPGCGIVRNWKKDRNLSGDYTTTDWSTPGKGTPRKLTENGKQAKVGNNETIDAGWIKGCNCTTDTVIPAIVFDPFGGSGTTALVANNLGRNSVLVEINPDYAQMAKQRLEQAGLTCEMKIVEEALKREAV